MSDAACRGYSTVLPKGDVSDDDEKLGSCVASGQMRENKHHSDSDWCPSVLESQL